MQKKNEDVCASKISVLMLNRHTKHAIDIFLGDSISVKTETIYV